MDEDPIDAFKVLSLTTSTTRRVLTAQCAGRGAEGDDDAAERFDGVEVAQPAGLMASPALTATTEALAVRRGDELIALFLIDKGANVQAVEAGETRLYGAGTQNATTVIRLRSNGAIDITSANNGAINISAHGTGDVVVNGGSKRIAREEDALNVGTLVATAGPYPVLFTYAAGTAGVPAVAPPGGVALAGVLTTGTGAARFKG